MANFYAKYPSFVGSSTTVSIVQGQGTAGTPAGGVLTVQGDPSGTPVPVSVSSGTTSAAVFQAEGSLAFGSITNAFQTIFTPSASTKILQMRNNTDASIAVSFDAGVTTNYVLDSADQVSFDFRTNNLVMSTTAIQIKYAVGAPTVGSFRVNACH